MDDLLAEFIAETREMLETISCEIIAWEAEPDDRDRLDAIFRFVHTVKGSSGFFDLPILQKLSHEAESALSDLRSGEREPDTALVSAILAIIDRIGEVTFALESGEEITENGDQDLIARLSADFSGDVPAGHEVSELQRQKIAIPRTIRVPVELLDQLMNGMSDLVLSRSELSQQFHKAGPDAKTNQVFDQLSSCISDLRDGILRTRMQRIEKLFVPLPRLVRNLSAELGKSVSLNIDGSDVELDREMIEMLRDPLVHIVRNALDHGIEMPAVRREAGKSPNGELRILARQSGNRIEIQVRDDGGGIDPEKLMARAIRLGIIPPHTVSDFDRDQALNLIFHPGLSTASEVSEISGRGVGMDVVRSNLERIGGTIEVESGENIGTSLILSVPQTLTIIPALIVGQGDQQYAIPRPMIDEIVSLAKGVATIEKMGGTEILQLRGKRMPIVQLADITECERGMAEKLVILRPARGERYALAISEAFDHEDLVIKSVAPVLARTGIYAGTALPDSGRPVLLLDIAGIAVRAGLRLTVGKQGEGDDLSAAEETNARSALLFNDLDGRRRIIEMNVIERIFDADFADVIETAGALHLHHEGNTLRIVAMGEVPKSGNFRVLCLNDGQLSIGYATRGTVDVVAIPGNVDQVDRPGLVAAIATLADGPVELLDPHYLFSEYGRGNIGQGERPTCLVLSGDSGWETELLVPLIEQAGYAVYFGTEIDPDTADIVIDATGERARDANMPNADKVVRLGSLGDAGAGTLGWYDRSGIYDALCARKRTQGAKQ